MTEIFSLDLDEEFLSHLSIPDSWSVIQGEGIDEALIEDEFVRTVFAWQLKHVREHQQIATASVLADEFDLELRDPETAIRDLIDRIRERYMTNQGREKLEEIIKIQRSEPLAVPQALLTKGRELHGKLSKRGETYGTGDFNRAIYRYDMSVAQGPGASFGHQVLDDHFFGMKGLNFLIGYKKSMKSWQMVQCLAANVEAGRYTWLYSLELPAEETDFRLRCLISGVPWWKYTRHALSIQDRKALEEASEYLDGAGVYKIVKPDHEQRNIHELVHTARDAGAELVLIDQLQYVENDKHKSLGRLNDTGEYFGVLDDARDLSDEGPIYIAHQFGRAAMGATEMPDIALAKGSSAIEEVCTLSLGLWASRDMRRSGILQIGTLIARNAPAFKTWEMEVNLRDDCSFAIVGEVEDETT